MARKGKGKGKGKGKQRASAHPISPPPVPARILEPIHPIASETVLSHEHSLEIVKTVITATMLEILHSRRVFPEADWQIYGWDPNDPSITYESFIDGVKGKNKHNFERTDMLMYWHFPKRGTPGLDKLLECLESGTQDALEKGHLHRLNLSIASVDDGPVTEANLIESYTMEFSYGSGNIISQIYSETRWFHSPTVEPLVLLDAKNGAHKLVDEVGTFLWNCSKNGELKSYPLPPYYRMIMAMDYNKDTPPDYQAPLFHQGDENVSRLLNLGHFSDNRVMKTRFHSVAVGWHLPGAIQPSVHIHQQLDNDDPGPTRPQRLGTEATRAGKFSAFSDIDGGHTQPEAMRQLGGMGASRHPNTETQDTRPLHRPSSSVARSSTKRRRTTLLPRRPRLPPYTQKTIDQLNNSQDHASQPEVVNCDCGTHDKTGDKVKCLKCGSFQHVQCYGYLDDSHPMNVVCYWCLLHSDEEPHELELYEEMQDLCVLRRLLYFLLKYGPSANIDELTIHINRKKKFSEAFLTRLQDEGYIQVERGLRNEKERLTFYTLVGDEENIRSNYFRPQQKISHYFALPESSSSNPFHDTVGINNQSGGQSPLLIIQNLSDFQSLTRDTRRLLTDASSTQDTSSYRSNSRSSSQTYMSIESPRITQDMTPAVNRGSSSKKRTADWDISSIPPKRQHPDVVSPWIRRLDGMQ